jgi:DNA-binding MarR family transcriptional regulator
MEIPANKERAETLDGLSDTVQTHLGRRILFALRRIIRAIDIYSTKLIAKYQITGSQLACLNLVVEKGPITATDLAGYLHLSTSTVVRLLDRLEGRDLIKRQRQEDDRRRVHVTATIAGHELSAEAPYSESHPLRRALKQLPRDQQAVVTTLLEQLVILMDAQELSAAPVLEVGSLRTTAQATNESASAPQQ